ncbi:hypothetical protein [Mucilaginibacter lutimaris]|uniref:hypothetical protein n=1 Tax=Mucilaginibacter lutimaris TaxID=931629 RepID=UPI00366C5FDF
MINQRIYKVFDALLGAVFEHIKRAMENTYLYLYRIVLGITDLIIINLCFYLGSTISGRYLGLPIQITLTGFEVACNIIWVILAIIFQLYHLPIVNKLNDFYKATFKVCVSHFVISFLYFSCIARIQHGTILMISFYGLLFFSFAMSRFTGGALLSVIFPSDHDHDA